MWKLLWRCSPPVHDRFNRCPVACRTMESCRSPATSASVAMRHLQDSSQSGAALARLRVKSPPRTPLPSSVGWQRRWWKQAHRTGDGKVMEKPLMRTFQSPQTITSSIGALAVVPPASMRHDLRQPGELWTHAVYALITVGCVVLGYYQFHAVVLRILAIAVKQHNIRIFAYPSLFWLGLGFLLIVIRTIFWIFYRPAPAATRDSAPRLTVIIPAYNEGAMVLQSIESAAKADYPHDRLEILVIDDGSKDDTWSYISQAAERYPGLVTALRQDRNRGKREALALGFSRARGEILVTIDSDSVIERGALLALAGPFRDPK